MAEATKTRKPRTASGPPTTADIKKVAEKLDKQLHTGACDRAPKRCFDPAQRGVDKTYAEWDSSKMCDSCASSWHAAQIVVIMTRKQFAERQNSTKTGAVT